MNLEELLRDGMEHNSSEVAVPPGLFAAAERRYRNRRTAGRTLALGGVVAVGTAVGVAVAGGPAPAHQAGSGPLSSGSTTSVPSSSAPRLETAGYLRARITAAIDSSTAILHQTNKETDGSSEDRWTDQRTGGFRALTHDAHGRPQYDRFWPGHGTKETVVEYATKTWSIRTAGPQPPRQLSPKELRDALAQHTITVVGHERLGGHDTVHVRYQTRDMFSNLTDFDTWVDTKTYLPLRVIGELGPGTYGEAKRRASRWVSDLEWLPRTAHSVALTAVRIPPGFKQTHDSI